MRQRADKMLSLLHTEYLASLLHVELWVSHVRNPMDCRHSAFCVPVTPSVEWRGLLFNGRLNN
jgi:hypothetical protein